MIKTVNLTKIFKTKSGEIVANDNISLDIHEGEIFTILGPNGAGKTTLVKIISTLILPTSGEVFVCGLDVVKNDRKVRKLIGLSTGSERSFYYRLSGYQNLFFFGTLYGLDRKTLKSRIDYILRLLDLEHARNLMYMKYSTGMKKKLSIARALLHDPPIYIFDEPTASVDPESARKVRDLIRYLKDSGKTLLLTTHNLHEAEELSDRVAILSKGKILAVGTPENLKATLRYETVEIELSRIPDDGIMDDLSCEKIRKVEFLGNRLKVVVENSTEILDFMIRKLQRESVKILKINVMKPSLEEVFLKLVRDEKDVAEDVGIHKEGIHN